MIVELLGLALLAVLAAFGWGRRQGRQAAEARAEVVQARADEKLKGVIEDAQDDLPDDIGVLRDSLRARDPGLR